MSEEIQAIFLPPDTGREVSGCKSFLGGWFVYLWHSGVTWVGQQ